MISDVNVTARHEKSLLSCLNFLRVHLFGHLLLPHLSYCPGPFPLFGSCKALTRQQVIKVGI